MSDYLIIDDDTPDDELFREDQGWDETRGYGMVKDYDAEPAPMGDPHSSVVLIPRTEWDARLEEMTRTRSSLRDIRDRADGGRPMAFLDQMRYGYCWSHSTVHALMLARAVANLPFVQLSAYSVAATVKRGVNQGGWCGLSAEFVRERGAMPTSIWPQGNANYRQFDTPANWAEAARYKSTEEIYTIQRSQWDQRMTFDQAFSLLLQRVPLALDFMWWAHSVAGLFPVKVEAGSYGIGILNSHANYGDNGVAVLRGSRANPDGGIGIRVATAA